MDTLTHSKSAKLQPYFHSGPEHKTKATPVKDPTRLQSRLKLGGAVSGADSEDDAPSQALGYIVLQWGVRTVAMRLSIAKLRFMTVKVKAFR